MPTTTAFDAKLTAMQQALPTRRLTLKNVGDGGLAFQIFYVLLRVGVVLGIGYSVLIGLAGIVEQPLFTQQLIVLLKYGLLFLVAVVIGMGVKTDIKMILPKYKLHKLFNKANQQPWQFVVLPVECVGDLLKFTTNIDGVNQSITLSCDEKMPMFLGVNKDKVVGLKTYRSPTVIPLWQKLGNINFTKAERQAIWQAYETMN